MVKGLGSVRFNSFLCDFRDVDSIVFCAMYCLQNGLCDSFSFSADTSRCRIHEEIFSSSASGAPEQGWTYYTSTYTKVLI